MADDPRAHQAVWELLPWLANGTATPAQAESARAHLAACAACRAALAHEQQLVAAFSQPRAAAPEAESGLQHLLQRLDRAEEAAAAARRPRRGWAVALAVAGAMELALLAVLAAGWRPPPLQRGPAEYHALGQPPAAQAGPRWSVVFDDRITLQELQAVLQQHALQVESGPAASGVYTLVAVAPVADADALAAHLRALPQVRSAERLRR